MANHNLPTVTSLYADFVTEFDARLDDALMWMDSTYTTVTNPPTNAIRWDATSKNWTRWNGSAWVAHSTSYSININGTVGATTPGTGAFTTLSTSGVASLGASSTVGSIPIVTTTGTQTLTNKTLTAPIISTISNTGTITLPTTSDTLVGRSTTDTMSNKTLTAQKVVSGDGINDVSGLRYVVFTGAASAVNYIGINNAATGVSPVVGAAGTDTNINLNLVAKGTGVVQVAGVPIVTTTGTQTLTNKTLTAPSFSTITNTGTLTLPTSSDTLVGRSTTDTLSNKTLTAPRFANGGFIADANGNELIATYTTASAINHIAIYNSTAGTSPSVIAEGGDTNVGINLVPKGTGLVTIGGTQVVANSGTWGISVTGNAATVTNGVYTTGAQTIAGIKTFSDSPQAPGFSTLWGTTNGVETGAFNATMGNSVYATWLLSGTVDGVFRAGIQALDTGIGMLRIYSDPTNYFTYSNGSLTATTFVGALTGNASTATTATTASSTAAALTFNAAGSGASAGTTFNGSAAQTISYNTFGATAYGWSLASAVDVAAAQTALSLVPGSNIPNLTGTGASGTWGISVTGNAATVTNGVYTTGDQSIAGVKTSTGKIIMTNSASAVGTSGSMNMLELGASNASAVGLSFHRSGYAINLGLDTDNALRFGGWSNGLNTYRFVCDTAGNFTVSGNLGAYSDRRIKKDLEVIPNAMDKVSKLTGYTYTRIDTGSRDTGLIAQDVQKVLPEAVVDQNGTLSLAYGNLVGLLVEAVKELKLEIDELRKAN